MNSTSLAGAQSGLSYALSIPCIKNGLYIAGAAHTARLFKGPLAGFLTLTAGTSAAMYTSSDPISSSIAAASFYYLPKALEVTVQKTVSEAGFWLIKSSVQVPIFLLSVGTRKVVQLCTPSKKEPQVVVEIVEPVQPIPLEVSQFDITQAKRRNAVLKRKVTMLQKKMIAQKRQNTELKKPSGIQTRSRTKNKLP